MTRIGYIPKKVAQRYINGVVGGPVKLKEKAGRYYAYLFSGTPQELQFGGQTSWMDLCLMIENKVFHAWLQTYECILEKKDDKYTILQRSVPISPVFEKPREIYSWWMQNRNQVEKPNISQDITGPIPSQPVQPS